MPTLDKKLKDVMDNISENLRTFARHNFRLSEKGWQKNKDKASKDLVDAAYEERVRDLIKLADKLKNETEKFTTNLVDTTIFLIKKNIRKCKKIVSNMKQYFITSKNLDRKYYRFCLKKTYRIEYLKLSSLLIAH